MAATGRTLIVGTRGSRLARQQTDSVVAALRERCPDCTFDVRIITTTGDLRPQPLSEIGGEGVFTKELETALLARDIDIAVHSLKDLPTHLHGHLAIAAVTLREDVRDALVSRDNRKLDALPDGARIGTGSARRTAQLHLLRPDLEVVPMRGNVDTRLGKVEAGEVDGIVVAAAALARLSALDKVAELLSLEAMLPAPGQGALAVEIRKDDAETRSIVVNVDDEESRRATQAERAFLRRLGGGCRVPVAAYASIDDGQLRLEGLVADLGGERGFRGEIDGKAEEAESLGEELAESLLSEGADEILRKLQ